MSRNDLIGIHELGLALNTELVARGLPRLESDFGRYGPTVVNMVAEFNWWLRRCPEEYERVFGKSHQRKLGFRKTSTPADIKIVEEDSAHFISGKEAERLRQYWLYYAERDSWPDAILNRHQDREFLALLEATREELSAVK